MKKLKTIALCAFAIITLHVSQGNAQTNVSLITPTDSLSYAWGIAVSANGLVQHLQQLGVLSLEKTDAENAPGLNEFFRGLQHAIFLSENSPYAIGLNIGSQVAGMMSHFSESVEQPINPNMVLAGIMEVLRNQQTAITTSKAEEMVNREMARVHEAGLMEQFGENRATGNAFLTENGRRQGVITLPSGLQYEIIREGHGARPTLADRVRVHYHGTLIDGTVVDSTVDRGQDVVFGVSQVIAGWTEALQLMPVGSKWRLFIPYDLAYGSQDRGIIRPFSMLIFDVELLAIE